ncbi:hypothetical protein ANCCAN_26662 [Ancylostoma caninum]|uniref:Conserved oligomeric Golgi complex subunit 2 n=1 Tax=Ancylostoma caninum TaxID=29170 RepID=A0A368F698_ANCCA|nr:hypothetical protein ANCCAN_26662 [Ancylostoma caninum]
MSTGGREPVSPRIFAPSSLVFDDSQLCFNKNHFGRPDFNVQRFMNLTRRRAGLKQIQQDLRLYLKSVQHSMIELINDDYADFVHLSSNLVSLQSSIDKIENDMNTIWTEFESSTSDAVQTAERVESFCVELSQNRASQIEIRHRISFLSALQRLSNLIKNIPETISALWLEKVSSCLVDASSYKEKLAKDSRECKMFNKCMGTVAVPSNTSMFHRCFTATQEFIESWPSQAYSRSMLKAVRDKFNLVVYFKLVTHKLVRQVDSEMAPESLKFTEGEDAAEGGMLCTVSSTILRTVETIWAEDVFLYPIADKLWDLTLRLLEKHLAWARALLETAKTNENSELGGVESWRALLAARHDLNSLHSKVFDMALEQLWPKLSDMGVDTSLFGQCLTRFGILADAECAKIDEEVINLVSSTLSKVQFIAHISVTHCLAHIMDFVFKEFDAVSDVPKQYRWTKKPSPSTHSAYITTAHSKLDDFISELSKKDHPSPETLTNFVIISSYGHLVSKAGEVLDSVDATGSSLSRFKRKGAGLDGTTDDDKIRTQVGRVFSHCFTRPA